jgi:hypothetical protein
VDVDKEVDDELDWRASLFSEENWRILNWSNFSTNFTMLLSYYMNFILLSYYRSTKYISLALQPAPARYSLAWCFSNGCTYDACGESSGRE